MRLTWHTPACGIFSMQLADSSVNNQCWSRRKFLDGKVRAFEQYLTLLHEEQVRRLIGGLNGSLEFRDLKHLSHASTDDELCGIKVNTKTSDHNA